MQTSYAKFSLAYDNLKDVKMTTIHVIYPAYLAESAINTLCMNNSTIINKV